ncbi:hypothetical protein FS837_006489 [Tulasnella sp. UAMH 9824]|nr:hypothetical protein FS837_006489 [Tulasnella sp. UAMH 9824]
MSASSAPLFKTRLAVYFLAFALAIVSIGAVFNAQHETGISKANTQAGVSKLTPGVTVYIGTSDVWNAGVAEGIANLLLGATSGLAILALLFSARFPPFLRTGMMPLLLVLWTLSTVFVLVTSTITTVFVATRQAKVEAFLHNGTRMPDTLVQTFSKQLGMSPEYSTFGYLKFMSIAPWFAFVFALLSTILTVVAWRKSAATSAESEVAERKAAAVERGEGDAGSAEAINDEKH